MMFLDCKVYKLHFIMYLKFLFLYTFWFVDQIVFYFLLSALQKN